MINIWISIEITENEKITKIRDDEIGLFIYSFQWNASNDRNNKIYCKRIATRFFLIFIYLSQVIPVGFAAIQFSLIESNPLKCTTNAKAKVLTID